MSKNVIFPDTKEFDQQLAPEMKAKMDAILNPLGLNSVAIGSAHTPTPGEMSGDMDLQVDLDEVKAKFKTDDDKAARKALAMFVQDRGFQVRQAGVNVFVRLPVGDEFYQVDLETIPNVAKVSRYHQHKIPKGSVYKGVGKQLMLAQLAKSKGYMYSAWQGLFARTPENKKGELVADEWDDIARVLLGPNATGDNIDSVEAIMASLPEEQAQALLAHVKQDKNWAERTPKISEDIRRMKELAGVKEAALAPVKVPPVPKLPAEDGDLGDGRSVTTNRDGTRSYSNAEGTFTYDARGKAITYTSPKMSGYNQTLDLATNQIVHDYHAVPLQVTNKVDAQGKPITSRTKYNLGPGIADTELDHASGITSNTFAAFHGDGTDAAATLAAAHRILPTAAIAGARGVDPKKFAAFQKQNPTAVKESPELIAMLSIAGLR